MSDWAILTAFLFGWFAGFVTAIGVILKNK